MPKRKPTPVLTEKCLQRTPTPASVVDKTLKMIRHSLRQNIQQGLVRDLVKLARRARY